MKTERAKRTWEEVLSATKRAVAKHVDVDVETLVPNATIAKDCGVDSVTLWGDICEEIENVFDIIIERNEEAGIATIYDFAVVVAKKLDISVPEGV